MYLRDKKNCSSPSKEIAWFVRRLKVQMSFVSSTVAIKSASFRIFLTTKNLFSHCWPTHYYSHKHSCCHSGIVSVTLLFCDCVYLCTARNHHARMLLNKPVHSFGDLVVTNYELSVKFLCKDFCAAPYILTLYMCQCIKQEQSVSLIQKATVYMVIINTWGWQKPFHQSWVLDLAWLTCLSSWFLPSTMAKSAHC